MNNNSGLTMSYTDSYNRIAAQKRLKDYDILAFACKRAGKSRDETFRARQALIPLRLVNVCADAPVEQPHGKERDGGGGEENFLRPHAQLAHQEKQPRAEDFQHCVDGVGSTNILPARIDR